MARILQACMSTLILFVCMALGAISYMLHHRCIDVAALEYYAPGKATVLLDCHGNEWTRFEIDRRKVIPIEQIPKQVIEAFLAAEDWHFYAHRGISFKGIVRSLWVNITHGRVMQGASTITQQLVRLLFFDHKRTFTRKIKEQLVSLIVEIQFSKEQILETYLNHVYFGCGIYGVEAAARRFWGISVTQVSLDQSAVLASVIRSPGIYCPLLHPEATERRRNVVLGKMLRLNFITKDAYDQALAAPLEIMQNRDSTYGLYARESIRQFLEQRLGDELYTQGYLVKTTLDPKIQHLAEQSFNEHVKEMRTSINPAIDGGLLSMEVKTGQIRALVGGYDYYISRFNRALQAQRQLGSVFKLLIFAAALQQGKTFADLVYDEPITIVDAYGKRWEPQNYNLRFNGWITLAYALSHSNNIGVIKTFLEVGADPVIALAQKCHLPGPYHTYASLSLGCIDVTLAQAVGMFNIFANNGMYVQPHLVSWIKDSWGTKVYKQQAHPEPVLEPHISGQILKVSSLGLNRVYERLPQKWIDSQAASKTGTTNDWRTCWFIGSTPELTTGIYIGCDDNCSMGNNVYPLHTAFPIWIGLHREVETTQKNFTYDPSLKEIIIDEKSGKVLSKAGSKNAIAIYV